jgi:hypothetical protein
MILKTIVALGAVGGVWVAGWGTNVYLDTTYADKRAVMLAESKLEKVQAQAVYALDRQMTGVLREINRIEDKPNKTPDDRDQLKFLRETLKEMREVRNLGMERRSEKPFSTDPVPNWSTLSEL